MGFFKGIGGAIDALSKGKELTDSAGWKNKQTTTNNLVILLAGLLSVGQLFGLKIEMDPTDIATISAGIAVILSMFNSYITVATSKKVGVGAPPPPVEVTVEPESTKVTESKIEVKTKPKWEDLNSESSFPH